MHSLRFYDMMLSAQERTYLEHIHDFPQAYGLVLRSRIRRKLPTTIRELTLIIEQDEPKRPPSNRVTRTSPIGRWQGPMLAISDVYLLIQSLASKHPTLVRQGLENRKPLTKHVVGTAKVQIGKFRGRPRPSSRQQPIADIPTEVLEELERRSPDLMLQAMLRRKVSEYQLSAVEAHKLLEDWNSWRKPRIIVPTLSEHERVVGEFASAIVSTRDRKGDAPTLAG